MLGEWKYKIKKKKKERFELATKPAILISYFDMCSLQIADSTPGDFSLRTDNAPAHPWVAVTTERDKNQKFILFLWVSDGLFFFQGPERKMLSFIYFFSCEAVLQKRSCRNIKCENTEELGCDKINTVMTGFF